jgi:hypothetical protein
LDSADVVPYFYIYGLLLARAGRCGEAIPISQALEAAASEDEVAMSNALEMVTICEEQGDNPSTATPQPSATAGPTETQEIIMFPTQAE